MTSYNAMLVLDECLNLAGFTEEDCCVEFDVIALSSTCIDRSYGKLCFPKEVLEAKVYTLIGKPVLLDHKWEVENMVGVVVKAWYEDGKVFARLRIPKQGNERLIALLQMTPSPVKSVSAGLIVRTEKLEDKYIVQDLEFKEISFVFEGADKNARVLNSRDCGCQKEALGVSNWWDDPELREKAPKDYFLDPESRQYPYRTWEGEISCGRLKAAMSLASLHGHHRIYARAKTLYENHCNKGGGKNA
jgi:hypothetical protein